MTAGVTRVEAPTRLSILPRTRPRVGQVERRVLHAAYKYVLLKISKPDRNFVKLLVHRLSFLPYR